MDENENAAVNWNCSDEIENAAEVFYANASRIPAPFQYETSFLAFVLCSCSFFAIQKSVNDLIYMKRLSMQLMLYHYT